MVLVAGAWMSATQFIKSTYIETSPTFEAFMTANNKSSPMVTNRNLSVVGLSKQMWYI
jgi:hypothetical protein